MKTESQTARDEALDSVINNSPEWRDEITDFIENKIPWGWEGTGEDIRHLAKKNGIGNPRHHNAWGSVIMHAVRKKWLVWNGKISPMRDKSSHARLTRIYTRCDPEDQ